MFFVIFRPGDEQSSGDLQCVTPQHCYPAARNPEIRRENAEKSGSATATTATTAFSRVMTHQCVMIHLRVMKHLWVRIQPKRGTADVFSKKEITT